MHTEFSFQKLTLVNRFHPNNLSIHLGSKTEIKFWVKGAEIVFPEIRGGRINVSMNMDTAASSLPTLFRRHEELKGKSFWLNANKVNFWPCAPFVRDWISTISEVSGTIHLSRRSRRPPWITLEVLLSFPEFPRGNSWATSCRSLKPNERNLTSNV